MASVKVVVRARPLHSREVDLGVNVIVKMEEKRTYLVSAKPASESKEDPSKEQAWLSQKQFLFDRSYWSVNPDDPHFADQKQIFDECGVPVVQAALDGYNACVFAYGQTGAGKTYTMSGRADDKGLIPRICETMFAKLAKYRDDRSRSFRVEVSYMEIYNEDVRDLLSAKQNKGASTRPSLTLRVREHPKEGPFVQDLTVHPVSDYSSIESLMKEGNALRVTAATKMNDTSSRSHAIFTIRLTQAKFGDKLPSETISKVNLVDLAGSERVASSGATGIRLKEGNNINKSLVTLGLVISALAEISVLDARETSGRKKQFVPYRDSVLTWLLKDSIGGNSKTLMIAAVSPADIHYGETLSTLRYASRARKIVNKPVVNEDPNVKIIKELRAEILRLKALVQGSRSDLSSPEAESQIKARLHENEEQAEKLTKSWLSKWQEAQKIFEERNMTLSSVGHQTVLTSQKPHLVGLDVDPLSTDIVLYHLEEGDTIIGSGNFTEEQGVALEGSGIQLQHCRIQVKDGRVALTPMAGLTYVNDNLISADWELRQGDIVQFGDFLKFRFNDPREAEELREKRRSGSFVVDPSRFSHSVLHRYRSMDSGLSSPVDFDLEDGEPAMNSTAISTISVTSRNRLSFTDYDRLCLPPLRRDVSCSSEELSPILRDPSPRRKLQKFISVQDLSPSKHPLPRLEVSCSTEDLAPSENSASALSHVPRAHTQSMLELPRPLSAPPCMLANDLTDAHRTRSMIFSTDGDASEVEDVFGDDDRLYAETQTRSTDDVVKDNRSELKALIDKYRKLEISRLEADKETLTHAADSERTLKEQQARLKGLEREQRQQLEVAKSQLEDFVQSLNQEKFLHRQKVEKELDALVEVKRRLIRSKEGVDAELRKRRFRFKAKIEDYWKRMDLYDNLLVELELEKLKTEYSTRKKSSDMIKHLDLGRGDDSERLREQRASLEDTVGKLKHSITEAQKVLQEAISEEEASRIHFAARFSEPEKLIAEVRERKCSVIERYELDAEDLNVELRQEEEKLRACITSNVSEPLTADRESDTPGGCSSATGSLQEVALRDKIAMLCRKKTELGKNVQDRILRFDSMASMAERSLRELRQAGNLEAQRHSTEVREKRERLSWLERQLDQEKAALKKCKAEMRVHGLPNSRLSGGCPEEAEEDMQAIEIQREQLMQSKLKVKENLQIALRKDFEQFSSFDGWQRHGLAVDPGGNSGVDQAMALIFHASDSSAHINSVIKKHVLFEERRRGLHEVRLQLRDLRKKQLFLHQELSRNLLNRKALLDEMRGKERQLIHDRIQVLIDATTDQDFPEDLTKGCEAETSRLLSHQQAIDDLESSLHVKMDENRKLEEQLLDVQDQINQESHLLVAGEIAAGEVTGVGSVDASLQVELDALERRNSEAERLIDDLRRKLEAERGRYLEVLKNRDDYEVISRDYHVERHSYFKVEGNQAAAEVLQEVFYASNAMEAQRSPSSSGRLKCGGWTFQFKEKNVDVLRKTGLKPGCLCVIGHGVVEADPNFVWEAVRNPLSRLIYDTMVKKINIVEHVSDVMKIVYFQHEARVLLLKQSRDFCCVQVEHIENNKFVSAFKSVDHPDCPPSKKITRSKAYASGWVVEPCFASGRACTSLWYVLQVDLGGKIASYFVNTLAHKLPLSVSCLRNYLVLS